MLKIHRNFFCVAFSLVELMVTLVVVAVLTAAMAPVITKRLKTKEITVLQGGGGSVGLSMNCQAISPSCGLCEGGICVSCAKSCTENEALDIPNCVCKACNSDDFHGSACLKCDIENCSKCTAGYYLEDGVCKICENGFSCDGTNQTICPSGYYCKDGTIVACSAGTYNETQGATDESSCIACSNKNAHCTNCDIATGVCNACTSGYDIKNGACVGQKFEYEYTGKSAKTEYTDSTIISFTTSGTLTVKSNATGVVMVLGGGGGGEGGIYNVCGSNGGVGYSTISSDLAFYSGDQYSIVIGAGGSAGKGSQYTKSCGGTGGQTSFGSITANGGGGCGTGGSAVTFGETTYATGCTKGANTGACGTGGGCWVSYSGGGWTGTNGSAGYSGIAVLKIYK